MTYCVSGSFDLYIDTDDERNAESIANSICSDIEEMEHFDLYSVTKVEDDEDE